MKCNPVGGAMKYLLLLLTASFILTSCGSMQFYHDVSPDTKKVSTLNLPTPVRINSLDGKKVSYYYRPEGPFTEDHRYKDVLYKVYLAPGKHNVVFEYNYVGAYGRGISSKSVNQIGFTQDFLEGKNYLLTISVSYDYTKMIPGRASYGRMYPRLELMK